MTSKMNVAGILTLMFLSGIANSDESPALGCIPKFKERIEGRKQVREVVEVATGADGILFPLGMISGVITGMIAPVGGYEEVLYLLCDAIGIRELFDEEGEIMAEAEDIQAKVGEMLNDLQDDHLKLRQVTHKDVQKVLLQGNESRAFCRKSQGLFKWDEVEEWVASHLKN